MVCQRDLLVYVAATSVGLSLQLPLQQLAWLLCDEACRLLICGKGTAGAVAQQAALQVQQMLSLPMSEQV